MQCRNQLVFYFRVYTNLPFLVIAGTPQLQTARTMMNSGGAAADETPPRQVLCIRGEISAADACSLHSHCVSDHQQKKVASSSTSTSTPPDTSVSLLLLHGSWNLLCKGTNSIPSRNTRNGDPCQALSSILYAACGSSPHEAIRSGPLSVASITVDVDAVTEDAAIDVLGAPPNLPALALVADGDIGSGDGKGIIRYVDINHTVLLSFLRSVAAGGELLERHHEYDRLGVAVSHTLKNITDELHLAGRFGGDGGNGSSIQPMDTNDINVAVSGTNDDEPAIRIFIAGDRSQVGKSSVCLGLIGSLLKMGYPPSSLAYIKPATQCESAQLVAQYCDKVGVPNRPIGPVVYYKGFTRSFLAGETEDTSQLLAEAGRSVDDIAQGRRVVIVDGVGYPAVGSICGTDNAAVAAACGRMKDSSKSRVPMPVLLVGKSGVGDAVDSFNLNAAYFEAKNVPVLGSVFNRLPLEGFYSLENCKKAIESYFEQYRPDKQPFGFIPEVQGIANSRKETNESDALENGDGRSQLDVAMDHAGQFIEAFAKYVDVAAIISAAKEATGTYRGSLVTNYDGAGESLRATKRARTDQGSNMSNAASQHDIRLSRAQIEEAAKRAGAAGG